MARVPAGFGRVVERGIGWQSGSHIIEKRGVVNGWRAGPAEQGSAWGRRGRDSVTGGWALFVRVTARGCGGLGHADEMSSWARMVAFGPTTQFCFPFFLFYFKFLSLHSNSNIWISNLSCGFIIKIKCTNFTPHQYELVFLIYMYIYSYFLSSLLLNFQFQI
jgi:hypothetical protein